MNKLFARHKARIASIGILSASVIAPVALSVIAAPAAHASNAYDPNANQSVDSVTYDTGDAVSNGTTNGTVGYGNEIDQQMVAVDYGQMANIYLTRFTPALTVIALAGAVLLAAKGAVRMVHGGLRGSFH